MLGYNRKTIDRYFGIFRERILEYQHQALAPFAGEVELDESYFGARRVRGKRGRGGQDPRLRRAETGRAGVPDRGQKLLQGGAFTHNTRENP